MMRFVFGLCWALVFTKANGLALGAAPLPPTTSPTTLNLRDYVSAPTAIKTQQLYHPSLEAIT